MPAWVHGGYVGILLWTHVESVITIVVIIVLVSECIQFYEAYEELTPLSRFHDVVTSLNQLS